MEAAWWAARMSASNDAGERAYQAYLAGDDRPAAARAAAYVSRNYISAGQGAIGKAWLQRAERALEGVPESAENARVLRFRASVLLHEGRAQEAAELADEALEIATRHAHPDIQALALQAKGMALVVLGEAEEGVALQDEATVAAVSGDLSPTATGMIYCNAIAECARMLDYRRAGEWTEAAKRWCERQAISGFPGICRVYRAEIMRLRGAWPDAEQEVRRACVELKDHGIDAFAGGGLYELGEIRLRMGDVEGAEDAFRQAHALGFEPYPGLALVRLAQGRIDQAASAINRAVSDAADPLTRAKLLPAQVSIALEVEDLDTAAQAAEALDGIATTFGTPAFAAHAATARAALALARGEASQARRELRRAIGIWTELDFPYELAEARVLLGLAHRAEGDEDAASLELAAARARFEELGARGQVARVAELVGGPSPIGPSVPDRVGRTFMFTDIVKSTDLVEAIGDEHWADLQRWHDDVLRETFVRHGGEEVDHAGDGFFVAFPGAQSAIDCAVAIQRRLAEHRRSAGFAPQVRIGVHTTDAIRTGGSYRGRGVHEAARVAALAGGGEIVATRDTADAAGPSVSVADARKVQLKGIAEPVEVISIEWR